MIIGVRSSRPAACSAITPGKPPPRWPIEPWMEADRNITGRVSNSIVCLLTPKKYDLGTHGERSDDGRHDSRARATGLDRHVDAGASGRFEQPSAGIPGGGIEGGARAERGGDVALGGRRLHG